MSFSFFIDAPAGGRDPQHLVLFSLLSGIIDALADLPVEEIQESQEKFIVLWILTILRKSLAMQEHFECAEYQDFCCLFHSIPPMAA